MCEINVLHYNYFIFMNLLNALVIAYSGFL